MGVPGSEASKKREREGGRLRESPPFPGLCVVPMGPSRKKEGGDGDTLSPFVCGPITTKGEKESRPILAAQIRTLHLK